MLHNSGMQKEEVSEWTFVASLMQQNKISRLERCFWRGVASQWPVGGMLHRISSRAFSDVLRCSPVFSAAT